MKITELIIDYKAFNIINNTCDTKKVILSNKLPIGKLFKMIIVIHGNEGAIEWDNNIYWYTDYPPTLFGKYTIVAFRWNGYKVIGNVEVMTTSDK